MTQLTQVNFAIESPSLDILPLIPSMSLCLLRQILKTALTAPFESAWTAPNTSMLCIANTITSWPVKRN